MSLRDLFLLDPDVTFLNHGSFGACPRPVFERYQRWQSELEREPVDFIARRLPGLLAEARAVLGEYVGAPGDDLTFVPNASTGVNMAARTLDLGPGDEVLATDLEYGGLDLMWQTLCDRTGAAYVRVPVEQMTARIGERTRVAFVSHITSGTGLLLPFEPVVRAARDAGVTTIVDGAHAPAHVPLALEELGADFYAGNCHKWLCAPKGAGFLYVRPEVQERVDGAIMTWGYADPATFLSRTELQGTRDSAAYLTVPDAIAFVREHDDPDRCVALCREARRELCALLGTEPIAPEETVLRMASVRAPDAEALVRRLWDEHRIELPAMRPDMIRLSVAMYTERADLEKLLSALAG